jgi:lipoate-protein ligase A
VDGRKVAGSAQVRKRGVILQQGSILLGIDVERLFRVLKMPDDDSRCRLKTSFRQHAVPLKELLMREVNREEVAEAVARSFERAFHIRLIEGELSKEEKVLAQRLIHERYGKREWTLRR